MAIATSPEKTKRTVRLIRPQGTMYVDIWDAANPSSDAPPIVLVHGWGGTGSYWQDTAAALSETVPVYVPDLPGTGRSQPVKSAQNMHDQVGALIDLIEALELERVQIVGHSMGGAMVLLLAAEKPEYIERVVLTSLTFFRSNAQREVYRNVMKAFKVTMMLRRTVLSALPGMDKMMAKHYFYRVPKDDAMLKQGWQDFLDLDAATATACANDATDNAIPQAGAQLHVPTLLVACRQDHMMPMENVDYTLNIIPNCQVQWIEECGHLPMVEKPDEYLKILRSFLRS